MQQPAMPHKAKTSLLTPIIFGLLAAAMQGCKDEQLEDALPFSRFPLEVGRKWTYHTVMAQTPSGFPDTIVSNWEVVRTEMLNGRQNHVIRKYSTMDGNTNMSESYFFEDNTGLYHTAEKGYGSWIFLKKEQPGSFDFFGAEFFHAPRDTSFFDSLFVFDPPHLNLKYPLSMGDEWECFTYPGSLGTLMNKYEGTATVPTPLDTFNAVFVTQRLTTDYPLAWNSFFTNDGLVSQVEMGWLTNMHGEEGPYEAVTELTSVN